MGRAMTTIAILGLGEAGRTFARGLARAGADVRGFDPHHEPQLAGVTQESELAAAVASADAVLSLVHGAIAADVAADVLPLMPPGAVYADLNTTSPEIQTEIAARARSANVPMADVAVLAPVHRDEHRTPLLASGDGAIALAGLLRPLGASIEVIDGEAGEASRRKLLRSMFMKGLAALVLEGLGAARAVGSEDWLREQMAIELGPGGGDLVDRLVEGTRRHAVRREHEVRAALDVIEDSGQPADMTRATLAWFERIVRDAND